MSMSKWFVKVRSAFKELGKTINNATSRLTHTELVVTCAQTKRSTLGIHYCLCVICVVLIYS